MTVANFFAKRKFIALLLAISTALGVNSCSSNNNHLLWTFKAPRSSIWSNTGYASSPVIAGDTIVFQSGYAWHSEVYVHAIDRKTGKERWGTIDPTEQFVVHEGRVFVVSRPNFYLSEPARPKAGWICALDLQSGELLWKQTTYSSKNVRILEAGKVLLCAVSENTYAALDPQSGQALWQRVEVTNKNDSGTNVAAVNGRLYIERPDRSIAVADGDKGAKVLALDETRNDGDRTIDVVGDHLLVIDDAGSLFCADFKKQTAGGPYKTGIITSGIEIKGDTAFFGAVEPTVAQTVSPAPDKDKEKGNKTPDQSKEVVSKTVPETTAEKNEPTSKPESTVTKKVETKTSKTTTETSNSKPKSGNSIKDAIEDLKKKKQNNVIAEKPAAPPPGLPFFCAFDLIKGTPLWTTPIKSPALNTPMSGDNTILCAGERGFFYCFQPDGKLLWQASLADENITGSVYDNGVIYVNAGPKLIALDEKTGKELWSFKVDKFATAGSPVAGDGVVYMSAGDSNLYAFKTGTAKTQVSDNRKASEPTNATH